MISSTDKDSILYVIDNHSRFYKMIHSVSKKDIIEFLTKLDFTYEDNVSKHPMVEKLFFTHKIKGKFLYVNYVNSGDRVFMRYF